jgi:hypothetical protein
MIMTTSGEPLLLDGSVGQGCGCALFERESTLKLSRLGVGMLGNCRKSVKIAHSILSPPRTARFQIRPV